MSRYFVNVMCAKIIMVRRIFIIFNLFVYGINCINSGLKSPIEVVEEWGCYNSEIRLTCGNLDSKIAILEAVFRPNCTGEVCYRLDLKRLARAHLSPKFNDPRTAETEAGRKFLETLRKSHQNNDDADDVVVDEEDSEDVLIKGTPKSIAYDRKEKRINADIPWADQLISRKRKRTSLRASLERLLVRYLRRLSPDEDYESKMKRRSQRLKRNVSDDSGPERYILGVVNVTYDESELQDNGATKFRDGKYQKIQELMRFCPEQRRKIATLDRFDIEHATKNESEEEHNIRRIINRRCSGKNHCSFLFAVDHPLSVIWNSGMVYLKYICMEDFRMNHYCGEELRIGNEITPRTRQVTLGKGEPIAEARIQLREQTFHSLKILKSSEKKDNSSGADNSRSDYKRRRPKLDQIRKDDTNQGVYSQDFRVLKILPSNLDNVNDIEKVGNQIYFRTEDDTWNTHIPSTVATSTVDHHIPSVILSSELPRIDASVLPDQSISVEEPKESQRIDIVDNTTHLNFSDVYGENGSDAENVTLIIREGQHFVLTYSKPRQLDNFTMPITPTSVLSKTDNISAAITSHNITEATNAKIEDYSRPKNQTRLYEVVDSEVEIYPIDSEELSKVYKTSEHVDNRHPVNHRFPSGNAEFEEHDDDEVEYDDERNFDYNEKTGRKTHHSFQKVHYRKPLMHGFTMTPGYPKYYIGETDCKWKITAPPEQKIRLTVLDISLRYDPHCRDFFNVVDLEIGRPLFNSCSEAIKPFSIVSDSNEIEVLVKTTSKFAYPKRGVLLHYSALGCITPSAPANGRLVIRREHEALYECDIGFVFPDTASNTLQLVCTEHHTWDRILPDCVEKLAISGSGLVSGLKLDTHRNIERTTNTEMTNKEADMVYDIIIPSILIAGLFIVNAVVFVVILKYRKRRNNEADFGPKELAEL